jgi:2-haloacid dehalogenase
MATVDIPSHVPIIPKSLKLTEISRYQLEYTWRLNSMEKYKPFSSITRSSLQHALADSSETLSVNDIDSLMHAYDSLSIFPDVEPGLKAIASNPSIEAYVFSNGTPSMVSTSVNSSPQLSPFSSVFKHLITIDPIKTFKPSPRVYQYLAESVGKTTSEKDMSSVWLVSGNPFDVVGARTTGMQAAWVDRSGKGWTDKLADVIDGREGGLRPTLVVSGVEDAVVRIGEWIKKNRK